MISGTKLSGAPQIPSGSFAVWPATTEAEFNLFAAMTGFYWAQSYNMEGKKGIEYLTILDCVAVRYFVAQP